MIYKIFNSYGGFELSNGDIKLNYEDIKNIQVKTLSGDEGYIRIVGSTHIYEHGYSANESIYKIITLDHRVISLPDEIEIDGATNLMFSKIHEVEDLKNSVLVGKLIRVDGTNGTFKYDVE